MNFSDECVSTLHRYNEDLLRIREKSVVFNRILEQVRPRFEYHQLCVQDMSYG